MATSGKLSGTLYKITNAGVSISNLTSNSVNLTVATRDVTTKDSSGNMEVLPTILSATYSGEAIVALDATEAVDDLVGDLTAKSAVTVTFTTAVSGDFRLSQSAYFTNVSISAPSEDNVTYTFELQGTGAITQDTVT